MSSNKALWWGILVAWIAGSAYWHICKIKNLCDAPVTLTSAVPLEIISPGKPLTILDTPSFRLMSNGNFTFAKSGIIANKSQVYPEIDSLALYLVANKEKHLTITGFYSKEENNSTIFPDLGLARATDIKNWLMGRGVPETVFNIQSQIKNDIVFQNDSLIGGIGFSFPGKLMSTANDFAVAQKFESIFKPMELYFSTTSTDYIKTDQNQKFILEAKRILSENGAKKLVIVGHTDNENSEKWNLDLSKARADILKKQFVAVGIPASQIIALGKGKYEVELPDDTPAAKRGRNRVTIIAN